MGCGREDLGRCPLEMRRWAGRMVGEIADRREAEWAAMTEVAGCLGRHFGDGAYMVRQVEVDVGRAARHHDGGVGS